jgi:hypothetical protein
VTAAPEPGAWSFGASLTATSLHIEHIEADDPGLVTPYWHVQRLLISELSLSATRGVASGFGIGLTIPVREVRDRIRFEDLARNPYVPPQPDTHHRNETLVRVADPQLAALFTRELGAWTLTGSLGTSIPVGRTEPNPFELGRLGLPHQHIQFGTGTWDPIVSLSALRSFGELGFNATASAKLSLYENKHGYRAGNRYDVLVGSSRKLGSVWGANAGLTLDRESPEKWSGRIEEEGNLGRTDLMLAAGIGRGIPQVGALGIKVQVPFKTWATGEQVKYPLIVSLGWTH